MKSFIRVKIAADIEYEVDETDRILTEQAKDIEEKTRRSMASLIEDVGLFDIGAEVGLGDSEVSVRVSKTRHLLMKTSFDAEGEYPDIGHAIVSFTEHDESLMKIIDLQMQSEVLDMDGMPMIESMIVNGCRGISVKVFNVEDDGFDADDIRFMALMDLNEIGYDDFSLDNSSFVEIENCDVTTLPFHSPVYVKLSFDNVLNSVSIGCQLKHRESWFWIYGVPFSMIRGLQ